MQFRIANGHSGMPSPGASTTIWEALLPNVAAAKGLSPLNASSAEVRSGERPLCALLPFKAHIALTTAQRLTLFRLSPGRKMLRIMKLTAFLLLSACLQVSATGFGQKINLSMTNASLEKVFQKIEKQSGYLFWYSNNLLQQARKVDVNLKDASLEQALTACFRDQPFTYNIIEKVIVIKKLDDPIAGPTAPAFIDIKGKVTDENGKPIAGATVTVKGTARSVATNDNGDFTLNNIGANAVLIISHVNFELREIRVNDRTSIDIQLTAISRDLQDVVVTALGVKKDRRAIGYATSTVKGEDLLKAGATLNPALALYGKAAGVGVAIGSSGPTGSVNVRIRGAAGVESDSRTRPLFVVDGVPIYDEATSMESRGYDPLNSFDYGSGINDINPEDIESMEILKGAKATVLYGSQGLNGVVLITTKSGRGTRGLGVQVSHQITWEKPISFIEFQNEYGSGGENGLGVNDTATIDFRGRRIMPLRPSRFSFGPKFDGREVMRYDSVLVPYEAHPDNWLDLFRTGVSNRTSVAISGGGEFGSVRASYTHNNYQDILPGFYQRNHTFSFNGNFRVSPFASFEFVSNIYNIKSKNRRPGLDQIVAWGLNRDYDYGLVKDFYKDADGYRRDFEPFGLPPSFSRIANILWEQNDNSDIDDKFHIVSSIRSTLQFTKEISLVAQAAIDYTNTDFITRNKITRMIPRAEGGQYKWAKRNITVQNYQALINYEKRFMSDKLHIFAYGGGAYQKVTENNMNVSTFGGLIFPNWFSIRNGAAWPGALDRDKVRGLSRGEDVIYSVLGSATIDWENTYYLEFQARNDWNSTLPPTTNSYFYPGVSLTWNFTNNFTIPHLKYGKLRFAWADVGGGPGTAVQDRYFADDSYSTEQIPYPVDNPPVMVTPPDALFLEKIKPFRKREFEVGFNTRWLEKSRIEVDISFYTNNIYNQIIRQPISAGTGYSTAKINTGNVKNWGYEFFVKAAALITPKYRWDLTFTAANQYSKVKKLYPGIPTKTVKKEGNFLVVAEEGKPLGDIKMNDFVRDPQGNKVVDPTTGLYKLGPLTTIGNVNPKVFGGLYSDFFFKGFNFHIGIDYKFGGTIFSYSNNYLMGNGVIKASLPYRDESKGGMAYYIDNATGKLTPWEHNKPAPDNARDKMVYHDGMVLDGMKEINDNGTIKYEKNDIIVSSISYYQSYINDNPSVGSWPPDRLFKNDYIKLREVSVEYTLPKKISNIMKLQKVSVNAAIRNLGYIHKTLPNVDAEAALGAQGYIENAFYPTTRSYSLGVTVSF